MKGVELPINILVIVAIAVIVLLGLIALYFVGWAPLPTTVGLESIKNQACAALVRTNCGQDTDQITTMLSDFDSDQDGQVGSDDTGTGWDWGTDTCGSAVVGDSGDNLASLCECYYTRTSEALCKSLCGCPTIL